MHRSPRDGTKQYSDLGSYVLHHAGKLGGAEGRRKVVYSALTKREMMAEFVRHVSPTQRSQLQSELKLTALLETIAWVQHIGDTGCHRCATDRQKQLKLMPNLAT